MYGASVVTRRPVLTDDTDNPDEGGNADRYGAHARAVAALGTAYRQIPAGAPVRLAKRTSNLFRFGPAQAQPGLDVSGFDQVLEVDATARTADGQGMVTYERLV